MNTNFLSRKIICKNLSIGKYFSIIAAFIVTITVLLYCYLNWDSYNKNLLRTLNEQIDRVDLYFCDTMESNFFFLTYLGHYLQSTDTANLKHINNLLAIFKNSNKSSDVLSWSNEDLKVVAAAHVEVTKPIDISDRDYAILSKFNPGKIYLGKVVYARPINKLVMPVAMGVINKNRQYIGSIIFGFEISKIEQKLEALVADGVEFAFFDKDFNQALNSKNFVLTAEALNKIKNLNVAKKSGQLVGFSFFNNSKNTRAIYKIMDSYPYLIVVQFNRDYLKHEIMMEIFKSIIEMVMILFGLGLVFYVIKRILVNPVIKLSDAIESIAKDEDKEVIFPSSKIREFNRLIEQINQIHDYKERLKDADKSRKAFFANMSHELKTPLNGIIGFCKMLKADMYGPVSKEAKETLDLMFSSAQNLLSLINDLLDFSNMNFGKIELKEKQFDIDHEIKAVIRLFSNDAKNQNISIIYNSNSQMIFADQKMLKELLIHVISNAIKYSNSGDKIDVGLNRQDDALEISVRDYGVGAKMNNNDINIGLTDGYSRVNVRQGPGMGLTLVKKIADLHQGKILINNELEQGFEIKFILPKSRIL